MYRDTALPYCEKHVAALGAAYTSLVRAFRPLRLKVCLPAACTRDTSKREIRQDSGVLWPGCDHYLLVPCLMGYCWKNGNKGPVQTHAREEDKQTFCRVESTLQ